MPSALYRFFPAILLLMAQPATSQTGGPSQPAAVEPHELPPIVVEGEPLLWRGIRAAREEVEKTPGGVTLVEDDMAYERNTSSLADFLRYVPGVWAASNNGSNDVFFSIRGSNLDAIDYDRNGVLLLKNGLPLTAADGTNHNRLINPLIAEYAVVARGANAAKYGASTLGGAINVISPTAYTSPPAQIFLNGGSFGQVQGLVTVSKVFNDQLDGLLALGGKRWGGYRDHNEQRRWGLYGNLGWKFSDSVGTRLYATYIDADLELPGALTGEEFKEDPEQASDVARRGDFQRDVDTWRLADKTTWRIDDNQRLDFGVSYEEQSLFHPIVADVTPGDNPFFDGLLIKTDHRNIGAVVRYRHEVASHDLLFGLNAIVGSQEGKQFGNDGGERGDLQTLVDQEAQTFTVYATDRWDITDKWTLVAALQYAQAGRELNNTTIADFGDRFPSHVEGDYSSVNPSLGLIYRLRPELELYANVSRIFEPPTNFQLQDELGNEPDAVLDAMSGTVVEIGTRGNQSIGQFSSLGWEVSLYYTWLNDEILSTEPTPGVFVATNIDSTIHAGIEALFYGRIALDDNGTHAIAPVLSFTVNEFHFDDDPVFGDNQLPAAPEYALKGELLYRHANGFYAGPTFDVVGERFADFANTYRVDSYALLGFLAGWSNDRLQVYLEVENLLDEEYVATNSVRGKAGPNAPLLSPGAPRAVFAGVQYQF